MNKITKILFVSFLAIIAYGCDDDKDPKGDGKAYFEITENAATQSFLGDSDAKYVTINTNRKFTATSSDESWCTVGFVDDKVDNLKISVTKNENIKDRVAQVIVSSEGFDNIILNIKQTGIATITVDKSYVLINDGKLEFALKIKGNVTYALEMPDWVEEKGNDPITGTHTFKMSGIAPGERSGEIVIKAVEEIYDTRISVPIIQRERIKKVGSWLFEDAQNLVKASVGKDLEMVRNIDFNPNAQFTSVDGPSSNNKAVRIPVNCHFVADHAIIPKADENFISEYTLFYEFKIPIEGRFYSLFQTNLANTGDAEIFIRGVIPPTIGVGATGYGGAGLVEAGKWHRLYLSFKPGDVKFFIDGQEFHTSATADSRFRLDLNGVILCGGPWAKKDDNEFDIAEMSIWNGALTLEKVKELEGIK